MRKIYASLCCLLIFLATACAINPVTGKRELSLISEQQETALGKETDNDIRKQYGFYDNPSLNEYIKRVGLTLTPHTHRPHLDYHFAVLDSPVVNAFAVPGGYIYVTRGILAMINSEAELAVILGHELGHVNARHSVRKLSQLFLIQLGLVVGSALSETFAKISGIASIGIQLLFLKFSRDDEREADALGVEYSRKSGYNPGEMINFFTSLQKLGDLSGGKSLPGFLSTHPLTSERIKNVKAMLEEKDNHLLLKNDFYLHQIENIVFGDNPQQGYVEGNTFFHPQIRFFFSFSQDWKFQNTPTQVVITSKDSKAAMILQVEKSSDNLRNFAQKKVATIEGRQFLKEQSRVINGMSSYHQLYDVVQKDEATLRMRLSFIRKGSYIFSFMALSTAQNFRQFDFQFINTVNSFKELKDRTHINRKPKRIRLSKASGKQSLGEIFQKAGIKKDLWPKIALLNRMELNHLPAPGKLIKIIK